MEGPRVHLDDLGHPGALYETAAMDPAVIAGVAVVLLLVALAAILLPARRAARTDPVHVLSAQ